MLIRIALTVCLIVLGTYAAPAAEWPAKAKADLDAAGLRLKAATTPAQRVAALRDMEKIAAANPRADQAPLLARMMAAAATQEAGPAQMLAALGHLAAAGQIKNANTLTSITGPLISAIADMERNGTLLPEVAIQVDDAIKKIDAVAAKAGLPKIADANAASPVAATLSRIAALARAARDAANLNQMNEDAKRRFIDNLVGMVPASVAPAISGPGFVVFRDTLVWNSEMYGQATKALDLVSDAISTGQFNHEAFAKIESRLHELSRGPWGGSTASDFFEKLCKGIPVAGAWCGDVFKFVKAALGDVDCDKIDCDCAHVRGGLMKGPLTVQCEIQQKDLVAACTAQKKIVGSCLPDARGPKANPK